MNSLNYFIGLFYPKNPIKVFLILICLYLSTEKLWAEVKPEGLKGMALVPEGDFIMGITQEEENYLWDTWKVKAIGEAPRHTVFLSAFYIDRYEVTNEDYKGFLLWIMETNHDRKHCHTDEPANWSHVPLGEEYWAKYYNWSGTDCPSGKGDYPVAMVSWYDAYAYAHWVGKDLPTEAQWEKATRGTDGRMYPWGDYWDASLCNSAERVGNRDFQDYWEWASWFYEPAPFIDILLPVKSYPEGQSPYGCLNMAGNVWEWCLDWYDEGYYSKSPARDPKGPDTGRYKVNRGGGWNNASFTQRTTVRYKNSPSTRSSNLGFRCVLNSVKTD